jgi:hypothetical protein
MGHSLHVNGIKPPDKKWKEMKDVWDACKAAKIDPPTAVELFFFDGRPDNKGVVIDLEEHECVTEYKDDMIDGYDVDLSKLPPDIKIIRFYCSY